jgi:flavin-binding protein dodecin
MHIKHPKGNKNFGGPMDLFWGQSPESISHAIQQAVASAKVALPHATFEWLEVAEIRGGFDNNVLQFQVSVRIGYNA